jgi:hypothetical protein
MQQLKYQGAPMFAALLIALYGAVFARNAIVNPEPIFDERIFRFPKGCVCKADGGLNNSIICY